MISSSSILKGGMYRDTSSPLPFEGENVESFVTLIPNLIHKSLKAQHFLNETSKLETQPPKSAVLILKITVFFLISTSLRSEFYA